MRVLLLALAYLGIAVAPPYGIATIHNYGVMAFFLVWLAELAYLLLAFVQME